MEGEESPNRRSKLKVLIGKAGKVIREVGKPLLADLMRGFLRIDPARKTLSIADKALVPGLNKLAEKLAPEAGVTVEPQPSGFKVGATLKGKRASALLELEQLAFARGAVTVRVRTPEGIQSEKGGLAQVFAALVARFFGGSWLGRKLFSTQLPTGVTWDGSVATVTVDLLKQGAGASELANLVAVAQVSREDGWTTFELDKAQGLQALGAYLAATLSKLAFRSPAIDPERE
jgi:hypothetical protein